MQLVSRSVCVDNPSSNVFFASLFRKLPSYMNDNALQMDDICSVENDASISVLDGGIIVRLSNADIHASYAIVWVESRFNAFNKSTDELNPGGGAYRNSIVLTKVKQVLKSFLRSESIMNNVLFQIPSRWPVQEAFTIHNVCY